MIKRNQLFLKIHFKYLFLVVLLSVFQQVGAQQKGITYSSSGQTLNIVLEEISAEFNVKFGFDSDLFQEIVILA